MGANNSKNAEYGNRHCKSSNGGCPDNALIWVGEGNFAMAKGTTERYAFYGEGDSYEARAKTLAVHGIDADCWHGIVNRLQVNYGIVSKSALQKEIDAMDAEIFEPKGLIALYGEYGVNQYGSGKSCLCVYTQEEYDKLREGSKFEVHCKTK